MVMMHTTGSNCGYGAITRRYCTTVPRTSLASNSGNLQGTRYISQDFSAMPRGGSERILSPGRRTSTLMKPLVNVTHLDPLCTPQQMRFEEPFCQFHGRQLIIYWRSERCKVQQGVLIKSGREI
jgi:hypothetical protein